MSQATLPSQPPPRKDDALALSLDRLRQALAADVAGREREWAEAVGDALARVETTLRQHRAAAKAPDGLLAAVDETRPTLARQAHELRSDHDDFLKQILALRDGVRGAAEAFQPAAGPTAKAGAGGVADFGAIRHQAEQLLAALQDNKEAETKLVLESINTDIGVGD
jgi:hypothetical protein